MCYEHYNKVKSNKKWQWTSNYKKIIEAGIVISMELIPVIAEFVYCKFFLIMDGDKSHALPKTIPSLSICAL